MHIFIAYTGTADAFSWVLPTPTIPKLSIGSNEVFARLRRATKPTFKLNWDDTGCKPEADQCPVPEFADAATSAGGAGSGGVEVLAEGSVGPFDFAVIQAASSGDKTAGEAARDWLNANNYDQPASSAPLLDEYATMNHVFVALKLSKDKTTGEIQPLVLQYEYPASSTVGAVPCVPLKLTQIAATDDMPVVVYVLGQHRAVPVSFFEAEINPKAFPWLECASGIHQGPMFGGFGGAGFPGAFFDQRTPCDTKYEKLIADAVNGVEGHAFVTEMSGPTTDYSTTVINSSQRSFNGSALTGLTNPGDYLEKMLAEINSFGFPQQDPLLQAIIRAHIPKRNPLTNQKCQQDRDFYRATNLKTNGECFSSLPDSPWAFNPTLMTAEINNRIVKPIIDAQALINSHQKLTRLTCILDANQMTIDPVFTFNPDLGDVAVENTATAKGTCGNDPDYFSAVTITFPDGTTQELTNLNKSRKTCSPVFSDITLPGNPTPLGRVRVLGASGEGETLTDTSSAVLANRRTAMLASATSLMPTITEHVVPAGGVTDGSLASTAVAAQGNGGTPSPGAPGAPSRPNNNINFNGAVSLGGSALIVVLLVLHVLLVAV
eukprot:TRINITY_DN66782_c13_g2_i1.p1 TRINITY_DN66782_c13_g2~~TRINITY_DN66782_c13_g2_i1.p1  ORF type:complete len:663 (+),score=79.38 TRINITY_DN66782_c13_g2_i1:180-1991(+)